ncbi:ATP-binding cassette domain-containing protein [Streptobacillus felis]|uniref:ABC transporter ATP-binding protein n=1 Tax=Streptobacillus felis TaxID=1384509 RepID=UPI000834E700|nr:ATP-binding cassette domain-containing protein [Streptobacillus felis]
MKIIKFSNVYKKFESKYALKGIDLEIKKNSIVAIIGESGSGKSTIGKIISGLILPTKGEVEISGKSSMIYQEYTTSINPKFSVLEVLEEVYRIKKCSIDMEKIHEILKFVSLNEINLNMNSMLLSGGEKQRLVIARAIIYNPDIFVFDEAISSLDIHLQLQIIDIIKGINKEFGKTIIFITHNIELLKNLTEDIIVLQKGKIVERGNILKESKNEYTKKLLNIWR